MTQETVKPADDQAPQKSQVQGEGNYEAGRKFDAEERAFVESGQVEQKAREAEEALDGPEAEDLERARKETGDHGRMGEA